jgi:osmotically-inducible protein OsmY
MIHRLGLALLSGVLAVCAFVCAFAASASYGQSSVGERVDKTINELGQTAHDVAGQIRETFEKARAAVERMGVEARVYARIHWDKALNGATVSVEVGQGGVATLRGTVPSEAAEAKAAQLAGDTIGVERVQDYLKVVAPRAH